MWNRVIDIVEKHPVPAAVVFATGIAAIAAVLFKMFS